MVEVEPLASGQSTEVAGKVEVCRRASVPPGWLSAAGGSAAPPLSAPRGVGSQAFYYNLSDSTVAYFPQGL